MRRRALAGLAAGALLVVVGPAAAADLPAAQPFPGSSPHQPDAAAEQAAVALLAAAARAGAELTYAGTQYVASWHSPPTPGAAALVEVRHEPGTGSTLSLAPTAGTGAAPQVATAALDARTLPLLAAAYRLRLAGAGHCSGRVAAVVEARRQDASLAGRFWVDEQTGLLLRREVYDEQGRRLRSSAFVDVTIAAPTSAVRPVTTSSRLVAEPVSTAALAPRTLPAPPALPAGFRLLSTDVDTPAADGEVLHLAYSDGLSTLSLFAQSGRLGTDGLDGFHAEQIAGRPVWTRHDEPERAVWSGGGRVWTLVSDASPQSVEAVVTSLPRDRAPDTGLGARLRRGLSRLGGLLNPFG